MLCKSWEMVGNQLTILCQIVANISKLYFCLIDNKEGVEEQFNLFQNRARLKYLLRMFQPQIKTSSREIEGDLNH